MQQWLSPLNKQLCHLSFMTQVHIFILTNLQLSPSFSLTRTKNPSKVTNSRLFLKTKTLLTCITNLWNQFLWLLPIPQRKPKIRKQRQSVKTILWKLRSKAWKKSFRFWSPNNNSRIKVLCNSLSGKVILKYQPVVIWTNWYRSGEKRCLTACWQTKDMRL